MGKKSLAFNLYVNISSEKSLIILEPIMVVSKVSTDG